MNGDDSKRKVAGVLVPVFSLRGEGCLGIGDTAALKDFINWADTCGFSVVKLLPINEVGSDNSPYNAVSSVALEPSLMRVSPKAVIDLSENDYHRLTESLSDMDGERVEYEVVRPLKHELLTCAFASFKNLPPTDERKGDFQAFTDTHADWIEEYTLFRYLMKVNETEQWDLWPAHHRELASTRSWLASLPEEERTKIQEGRAYYAYVQWLAFAQWKDVKAHAQSRGIQLMGDIPFGLNYNSADVWAQRHLFRTEMSGGTPPDAMFGHDPFVQKWGQNWGIPLYNWATMLDDDLGWWRRRVRMTKEFFDLFRIDHILGFYRIHGFPWRPDKNSYYLEMGQEQVLAELGLLPGFQPRADDTDDNKLLNQQDGERYLKVILDEAGEGNVVGEDLGDVPDYVRPSLSQMGIAGYKVPQWEKAEDGRLTPGDSYERLSLATYATHDHEPLKAMWESLAHDSSTEAHAKKKALLDYIGFEADAPETFTPELHRKFIKALFATNSWLAVLMITDVFGRGERFNLPGISGAGNWTQRMHMDVAELPEAEITEVMRDLLNETGRSKAVSA